MRKPENPETADRTTEEESDAAEAENAPEGERRLDEAAADAPAEAAPEADLKPEAEPEAETDAEFEPEADQTKPAAETEADAAEESLATDDAQTEIDPQEPPRPGEDQQEVAVHEEEQGNRSLATNLLVAVAGVLVIASLTLWVAPKVAPYLPAGVAKYLMPVQANAAARLAELDQAVTDERAARDAAVAAMKDRIAALSDRLADAEAAGQARDTAASATAEALAKAQATAQAAQTAAEGAAADVGALAGRLNIVESDAGALRDEFAAFSDAMNAARGGEGPTAPETAAALAALGSRIDNVAAAVRKNAVDAGAAVDGLKTQVAVLADRIAAVESSTANARNAQSQALDKVSASLHEAQLQGAIDVLASRLAGGQPYAAKLAELAKLSETAPPDALAAGAETGLATAAALEADFPRYAQAAIAADVRAEAGEGTGSQVFGWLRSQVAGRPTTEQAGDSAGAITSRIAARIGEGALADALTEAETLSPAAQAALGDWLTQLRARVTASAALTQWRAQISPGASTGG